MTLSAVSDRQKISLSHLEQLFGKLRRHGLVERPRAGGGYNLARARQISVADVILAVDEPIDATLCGGNENCLDDHRCMTHDLWSGLNAHIFAYLRSVTLPSSSAAGVARQGGRSWCATIVLATARPSRSRPDRSGCRRWFPIYLDSRRPRRSTRASPRR